MSDQNTVPDAAPTFAPMTSFGPVPDRWLWGTATAAHQIEGGNTNNDWWEWEHTPGSGTTESSGDATDSWNRWREDLQLVKDMGLDCYRFSLEWSRIEPAQGEYSQAALNHYRELMVAAHELGLKTSVTFHHFTTPRWAAAQGGWSNPEIVEWFAAFVEAATAQLGEHIDIAATIQRAQRRGARGLPGRQLPSRPPRRRRGRDPSDLAPRGRAPACRGDSPGRPRFVPRWSHTRYRRHGDSSRR